MKPTMEKMTKPANMLVQELMQQTMMESLRRRDGVSETESHQRRDREGVRPYLYTSLL